MTPKSLICVVVISLCPGATTFGAGSGFAGLLEVIESDARSTSARCTALSLACARADWAGAADIQTMASRWLTEIDASGLGRDQVMADEGLRARVELLSTFVGDGSRRLQAVVSDHTPLLEIWAALANRAWMPEAFQDRCCHAIANSPADLALRQAAAIDVIEGAQTGRLAAVPAPLAGLLDAATFPALREMVNRAGSHASCNFLAASHLAYWGDSQISSRLTRIRAGLSDGELDISKVLD